MPLKEFSAYATESRKARLRIGAIGLQRHRGLNQIASKADSMTTNQVNALLRQTFVRVIVRISDLAVGHPHDRFV
jgi:hypothetical protein